MKTNPARPIPWVKLQFTSKKMNVLLSYDPESRKWLDRTFSPKLKEVHRWRVESKQWNKLASSFMQPTIGRMTLEIYENNEHITQAIDWLISKANCTDFTFLIIPRHKDVNRLYLPDLRKRKRRSMVDDDLLLSMVTQCQNVSTEYRRGSVYGLRALFEIVRNSENKSVALWRTPYHVLHLFLHDLGVPTSTSKCGLSTTRFLLIP
ncbi:hypothetical protein PRIPAC_86668 [Pristionchus pacificus]|uniref:Uncharacterized protein n=1 Tax=Pristionchus pacificus TaxID=54126 RepID=A0A2A6BVE7_PRIPA|nr:hypothetical protein PRIPAC_86668 [Pristionchus pacificus]|eukprot:PDM69731.1 hypothetical protein PRIPAC_44827 [Pristionchus pacificus]